MYLKHGKPVKWAGAGKIQRNGIKRDGSRSIFPKHNQGVNYLRCSEYCVLVIRAVVKWRSVKGFLKVGKLGFNTWIAKLIIPINMKLYP